MKTIKTLNSTYEIDEERKLVRRTEGRSEPCNYIGEDGVWRSYTALRRLENDTILFVGENPTKGFITSAIVHES